jgi:hypothetical protein
MSIKWNIWGTNERIYEEVYLRCDRKNWHAVAKDMAKSIKGLRYTADLGSGNGHSTRQVLDILNYNDYKCDLFEPDSIALEESKKLTALCNVNSFVNSGAKEIGELRNKYDSIFYCSHKLLLGCQ